MSNRALESIAQVCDRTPQVNVMDNRGLAVRAVQYNRTVATEAANERISQQRYGALGELLSSIDPRLFDEQQSNPGVIPNFRYHTSLSGQVLRSQSQDAGDTVVLYDVEQGAVWQENSRGQIQRVAYDGLHRPTTLFEQDSPSAVERISERYVYGESEKDAVPANARGQLIGHYDPAGLNAVPSYNCTGQPLHQVRQLLSDPLALADWQGGAADWALALDAEQFLTRLGYNALNQVVTSVDATGNQQQQHFNMAGQLASSNLLLFQQTSPRPLLSAVRYSAAGQVLQEVAGNGVISDYSYEPHSQRLTRLLTTRPAVSGRNTVLQDLHYSYDPVGNILSIANAALAVSYQRNQRSEPVNDYQYDALYQLLSATGRENANAAQQGPGLPMADIPLSADPNQYSNYSRFYTYDRGGNLTQIRHQGRSSYTLATVVSPKSNHGVQQTGTVSPSDVDGHFDACGNLIQLVPGQPLFWDGRNQLQRVVQVVRPGGVDDAEYYQYDGSGQRVRKTTLSQTSGTQRSAEVIYLPGLELRRTRSTVGSTTTTVEDLQVITAGITGRQQVRVLHWHSGQPADIANDQLRGSLGNQIGSSVLELDQDANLLTLEEYFPYGGTAVWSGRSLSETKYKFVRYSGKELDASGLYYYGFRYYVPWLGRWLNPDPAGTVDGLNLYQMVRNNPVVLLDIAGLTPSGWFTYVDDKEQEIDTEDLNTIFTNGRPKIIFSGDGHNSPPLLFAKNIPDVMAAHDSNKLVLYVEGTDDQIRKNIEEYVPGFFTSKNIVITGWEPKNLTMSTQQLFEIVSAHIEKNKISASALDNVETLGTVIVSNLSVHAIKLASRLSQLIQEFTSSDGYGQATIKEIMNITTAQWRDEYVNPYLSNEIAAAATAKKDNFFLVSIGAAHLDLRYNPIQRLLNNSRRGQDFPHQILFSRGKSPKVNISG